MPGKERDQRDRVRTAPEGQSLGRRHALHHCVSLPIAAVVSVEIRTQLQFLSFFPFKITHQLDDFCIMYHGTKIQNWGRCARSLRSRSTPVLCRRTRSQSDRFWEPPWKGLLDRSAHGGRLSQRQATEGCCPPQPARPAKGVKPAGVRYVYSARELLRFMEGATGDVCV